MEKNCCPVCNVFKEDVVSQALMSDAYGVNCNRCGQFQLTGTALAIWEAQRKICADFEIRRAILSHFIRIRQTDQAIPVINSDDINGVLLRGHLPSAEQQANNFIRWLGHNSVPGEGLAVDDWNQGGIIGAALDGGFAFVLRGLVQQELLEASSFSNSGFGRATLSFSGWSRYEALSRGDVSSSVAFMAMPFGETEIANVVDMCFRPAVKETGFLLERLDDKPRAGLIDDRLRVVIQSCRFLVADVTHGNNGAYWEAGYAEGLGKPVIYTCKKSHFEKNAQTTGVHFDTNHHLTILWNPDELDHASEGLKATIRATIPEAKRDSGAIS